MFVSSIEGLFVCYCLWGFFVFCFLLLFFGGGGGLVVCFVFIYLFVCLFFVVFVFCCVCFLFFVFFVSLMKNSNTVASEAMKC